MIEATPVQKRILLFILQSLVDVTGKEWDEHIQELVE